MEVSIIQLNEAMTSSKTTNSSDPEATLLILKDLLPGIEEFNIKALPMMEDLRKLKRQAADQVWHFSYLSIRIDSEPIVLDSSCSITDNSY